MRHVATINNFWLKNIRLDISRMAFSRWPLPPVCLFVHIGGFLISIKVTSVVRFISITVIVLNVFIGVALHMDTNTHSTSE